MTDQSTVTATDVVVRMGELAASASAGDVLVCVGLGSCIGLALVCRRGRACGLAHIVLPDSGGREGDRPAKFAERAVPALIGALATMTGFELDLRPPESTRDMLGAVVASVLAAHSDAHELALVLDSELEVAGEACTLSFMLLPTPAGVAELLHRIGLGD